MRGNERTRRIPIIFVTAGAADSHRRFRGYEAGAVDFIQKPIEPDSKADVFFELYRQRQQLAAQRDQLEAHARALAEAGRRKDESLVTLAHVVSEEKHARTQQGVVLREVNHRIKNLFSVTAGLISLSAQTASSVQELATDLRARLHALSVAHDLTLPDLRDDGPDKIATSVRALLNAILAPHQQDRESRIVVTGSDAPLSGNALTLFALLLHELTTNAAKYGALSSPEGRLSVEVEAAGEVLRLQWDERFGKPSAAPIQSEGFGTTLEKAALKGIGGTLSRNWKSDGLALSLEVPLANLAR
jgi:two-component sensor histidine kinase